MCVILFYCVFINNFLADSHAIAGMALQCLKEAETPVMDVLELDRALFTIKQTLLDSQNGGHMGNEFSTGLAVQVRLVHF